MKKFGLILFGLLLFAASGGGAYWYRTQATTGEDGTADKSSAEASAAGDTTSGEMPGAKKLKPPEGQLPVAEHPRPLSVEEIVRLGMQFKTRERQLREREALLQEREEQLKLMEIDLKGEMEELQGYVEQAERKLAAAEQILAKTQAERQQLAEEQAQAESQLKDLQNELQSRDVAESRNLKQFAEWMQGMKPESSADLLKGLANDGQMDVAVQLLANLEDRDAAKVLEAIGDTQLVGDLIEEFKQYKRPEKTTGRRN